MVEKALAWQVRHFRCPSSSLCFTYGYSFLVYVSLLADVMVQVLEILPNIRETQTEFSFPGFDLALSWLQCASGEQTI